jgi:hypothetical protein
MQNKSRIDVGRLRRLSSAFGDYTVEGLTTSPTEMPIGGGAGAVQSGAALDKTTAEALKLVFSREGTYAQVLTYLSFMCSCELFKHPFFELPPQPRRISLHLQLLPIFFFREDFQARTMVPDTTTYVNSM